MTPFGIDPPPGTPLPPGFKPPPDSPSSFGELLEQFLISRPTWDNIYNHPQTGGNIVNKTLVQVNMLPLPVSVNIWLESNPRALCEFNPARAQPPFMITYGCGRTVLQKLVWSGVYTIPASSFTITVFRLDGPWTAPISIRALSALAFAPITLNIGGGL
jgi:hypothetical protein